MFNLHIVDVVVEAVVVTVNKYILLAKFVF